MSGDKPTNDEQKLPEQFSQPENPPARSAFSDEFDDMNRRSATDELPEEEELTPELVEEEAIRGDFMLRAATIFLALLMAFGQLNDTRPLALIRSGDWMRAHGFLPSRTDPLSLTMEEKSITNVSWLFDHVVSFSWLMAGEKGLTLLKVLVAGISAFVLLRISIPGVSTWWSTICAVFAVIACSSDYMPVPELFSILGTTLTMRLLFEHRTGQASGLEWKLPLLIAVWCNLDSRAWVGVGIILSYALGTALSARLKRSRQASSGTAPSSAPWVPAVLCVAALLVNPFHINSLLSPLTTYSVEYPAMQAQRSVSNPESEAVAMSFDGRVDYYSILNPSSFVLFDHSQIAGLALLLTAIVVLVMARSLRDLGFAASLAFVTVLVMMAAHELPAASIVCAVVAGVSAQDWYRRSCNTDYTTDARDLLYSRGGRAVTVLGLALIAFCVVTSRLPGAMPLGFGFDRETSITIESFGSQLQELPESARILHTRIEQGDLLIWHGWKSFVDSRILPFGRAGDPDSVFGKHSNVLKTLLHPLPAESTQSSDPQEQRRLESERQRAIADAKDTLSEFQVSHIMARLAPPGVPDYLSMTNLFASGEWVPVNIGASAVVLEKISPLTPPEEAIRKFPNFPRMAFQESKLGLADRRPFVAPPGFYEKYVYRHRPWNDAHKRLAGHYLFLASSDPQTLQQAFSGLAAATLAIRHLNASLSDRSDDPETYVLLGQCYARLRSFEQMLSGPSYSDRLNQLRLLESVVAFRQATVLDPSGQDGWEALFLLHQQMNRIDLAHEALSKWLDLVELNPPQSDEQFEEFLTQRYVQKREYEDEIQVSDERIDEAVKQQKTQAAAEDAGTSKNAGPPADPMEAVAAEARDVILETVICNSAGRPRRALQTLQNNMEVIRSSPVGVVLLGQLLLQAGELEEANRLLSGLGQEAPRQPQEFVGTEWQLPTAISHIGSCDYTSAVETWQAQLNEYEKQVVAGQLYSGLLFTLPMVADVNLAVNEVLPVWPFRHTVVAGQTIETENNPRAEINLLIAIARLEAGDLKDSKNRLLRILTEYGETRSRRLAAAYYSMMDDDSATVLEQNTLNIWEDFLFPGEQLPEPAAPDNAAVPTDENMPLRNQNPAAGASTPSGPGNPGTVPVK